MGFRSRDHEDFVDRMQGQPTTSRCAVPGCDWSYSGTAAECREEFEAHREEEHNAPRQIKDEGDVVLNRLADGLAQGVKINVPEEPPEHARKLLETLGAEYEVTAPPTKPPEEKAQTNGHAATWSGERDAHQYGSEPVPGFCRAFLKGLGVGFENKVRCSRRASVGDYCRTHAKEADAPTVAEATGGRPPTWDPGSITEALLTWAREHGRFPTSSEFQRTGDAQFPSYTAVRRHFDSWADALRAAGCPTDVPHDRITVAPDGTVAVTHEDQSERSSHFAPSGRGTETGSGPDEAPISPPAESPVVEPESEPEAEPEPETPEDEEELNPLELVDLIRDLDSGAVTLMRWTDGTGDDDQAAATLVRALARDLLDTYTLAEIGAAVLAQLAEEV